MNDVFLLMWLADFIGSIDVIGFVLLIIVAFIFLVGW